MAEEKPVHEQVQDLLQSWNPAPEDNALSRLVGDQGDNRPAEMDHGRNPGLSGVDAERMFADDGEDDDEGDDGLDDLNIKELRTRVDEVNADLENEEDHLSKGGSADDIRDRLREHYAAVEDEPGDDDEDDDEE